MTQTENHLLKPLHRQYFENNQGVWQWHLTMALTDWPGFWRADWPLAMKLRCVSMWLSHSQLGGYDLRTEVRLKGAETVFHRTRLSKGALTLYLSEKQFELDPDGQSLTLTGQEYLWPNLNQGLPFAPLQGRVLSATSAEYAMPFMGLVCTCVTHLDRVKDEILLENSWMKLVFRL